MNETFWRCGCQLTSKMGPSGVSLGFTSLLIAVRGTLVRRGPLIASMVDPFSRRYHEIIKEVRAKEPEVPDRYDVPEFGLYDVPLGDVLDYVYRNLVPALTGITTRVVEHAVPLPSAIEYMTGLPDEAEVRVRVIDRNTVQLTRIPS